MKWACGLIIGEADSPDSAEKLVRPFRDCPFSALVGAFEDKFVWALLVPEGHLPWLQSLDQQPEALGLKRANVFLTPGEKVSFPNRVLRLPQEKGNVAPCGARCDRCELYETCPGCPATVFHKGTSAGGEDVSENSADIPGR